MDNTMPLLNVGRKAALGNFAALPGSGPLGQTCSKCNRLQPTGSKFVCGHFKTLTGRAGKPIDSSSAACRYFIERPPFNATKGGF
jgi:hypothetical protein